MAAKKTLEEIREGQRRRAKKWRDANARKHRERVKELYGRSNAQKHSVDGVTPEELERYGRKQGEVVKYEPREVQETEAVSFDELESGPGVLEEQRARMEKIRPPGRGGVGNLPAKRVVAHQDTENEMKAKEDLVRLVERRKAEVEVEVEVEM